MQNLNRRDAAFLYIGVALRMAISLGLHQEVTDPEIDVVEREHRRRVWWSVYNADISVNMPSQLPGVESDKYVATVLSCYTHLSKILGKIMEGVYRKAHNSGPNLMLAVQNIMSELSTWFRKLPQQIQSDYNNLEGPIPRESVSIFLHYHQCINMVARPLMFHIIRKRLRDHHDTTQDWRLGLAPEAVQVIEKCITSARGTIQMMTEAFKQNLVAVYGFMDQEHAFSAALVLVMTNLAFPPSEDNVTASDAALALLRSIADRGNTHVDKRLSMLQELKVGPADNRASTSNDTHHPTTTNMTSIIYSQTTAPLGGPAEPTAILMQPSTSFGEDMSFGVDDPSFGLTGPDELRMWEEASGNLGATMDFDWIEEALRESAHE
ncbi:putative c6 transcription factor [Phaeomoniella chlamydospora]|uniref:Putative c6 transcription factor n=1 Tax=Phaeomoniella chlamydospora TaxID=158046 RepID=A0A0G2FUC5_PHACM|nr:putative c6 transcription factor [Phaeomoniella chlamydospora]